MAWPDLVRNMDRACLETLGVPVFYFAAMGPLAGISLELKKAIFDDAYKMTEMGTAGFNSAEPKLFTRLEHLSSDPRDDLEAYVMVSGVKYTILAPEPDGQGGIVLVLGKAV